jgi:hypothetical protein
MNLPAILAHDGVQQVEAILRREKLLRLHAFLSGGGLRVVRLERVRPGQSRGILDGYGEHPHIEEAMAHAAEDFAAGGRPYGEVYGKIHDHYLTGSSEPCSQLDARLRSGKDFDAWFDGGWMRAEIGGYEHEPLTPEVEARARSGEEFEWTSERGVRFAFRSVGQGGYCYAPVYKPAGIGDATLWHAKRRGMGLTLAEAITEALKATPEETAR